MISAVCLGAIVLLVGGLLITQGLFSRFGNFSFRPNREVIDFHTYFSMDIDEIGIIMDNERIETDVPPFFEDDILYLPDDFIQAYIDPFLFWDEYAQAAIVSSSRDLLHFVPDRVEFTINGITHTLEQPVKYTDGLFLPESLVLALYPYHMEYKPTHNLLVVTTMGAEPPVAEVSNKTEIRYRPDTQTAIVERIDRGGLVFTYEEEEEFTRVRTEDGLLGYILTEMLSRLETETVESIDRAFLLPQPINNFEPIKPNWPAGVKINMVWEDVHNPDAVILKMQDPIPAGVNVISPSFFKLGEEVVLESIASHAYVDWAHSQNVQVWAMVAGLNSDINHRAFTNMENRRLLVRLITEYAQEYNLHGINIDVEYLRAADGPYFIQFLRELAISLRPRGVILSADVLVPQAWSHFYRRDLMALTVDFLCLMAYDEHYPGSPNSGPVSSLPFVYKGVQDMLEQENVPKEQLILGLPFYNRVWIEMINNDTPENRRVHHFGMERTKALLVENNVQPQWNAFVGSFYGEYPAVEDGEMVMYKIWLEDENSIAEKLKIVEEFDLAGVSGWRRGFENEETQELIKNAVN